MLCDVVVRRRRRRRRRWAHAPVIHAASHFDQKKRVAWVPISMHTCGSFFYNYGTPLGGPSGRRSSAKRMGFLRVYSQSCKGNGKQYYFCIIVLNVINYSCSSHPTRASYSGQVDEFRNPMKNELKTRLCLKPVFEIRDLQIGLRVRVRVRVSNFKPVTFLESSLYMLVFR